MSFYKSNQRALTISAVLFLSFFCFIKTDAQENWRNYKKNGLSVRYTDADRAEIDKIHGYLTNGSRTIKNFFGQ
jgi:hypothetical protein